MNLRHPPVLALGYSPAAMLLRSPTARRIGAIIAIHGQREWAVDIDPAMPGLVLQFDDTEAPSRTDPLHAARIFGRQRDAARWGLRLSPPTVEHAWAIIEFAQSVRGVDGAVLCHCQGGVSRSPAAALLCLASWTGVGQERYCVARLLAARPCAVPHRDLVRFGDELLERNGALIAAVEQAVPY